MIELTQERLTLAWQKYCKAANRHGMPPNIEKVKEAIALHGVFEIRTGSEQSWTTKFQVNKDGSIVVVGNFTITLQSHKQRIKDIVEEFKNL